MINSIFCAARYGNGAKIVAVEGASIEGCLALISQNLPITPSKKPNTECNQHSNLAISPFLLYVLSSISLADLSKSGSHFDLPIALLGALQKKPC